MQCACDEECMCVAGWLTVGLRRVKETRKRKHGHPIAFYPSHAEKLMQNKVPCTMPTQPTPFFSIIHRHILLQLCCVE